MSSPLFSYNLSPLTYAFFLYIPAVLILKWGFLDEPPIVQYIRRRSERHPEDFYVASRRTTTTKAGWAFDGSSWVRVQVT